jgi:uncharacterized phage protein (TIGR02218 family)
MPRTIDAGLKNFLVSGQPYFKAGLYTIALANGTTYYWNDSDTDIVSSGITYSSTGPALNRSSWEVKNTVDIPEMTLDLFTSGSDMPDGSNILNSIHNGLFAGGYISYSIFYRSLSGTAYPPLSIFNGNVAKITIGNTVSITVKGLDHQFAQYIPKNIYSNRCLWSLYGAGCAPNPGATNGGPSRAAHTFSNTVGASPNSIYIAFGSSMSADSPLQFNLGTITFTSGVANGNTRTIISASTSAVELSYPLYEVPAVGDTYTVTHGCDHSKNANGCTFFGNKINFRGFPYIPPVSSGLV